MHNLELFFLQPSLKQFETKRFVLLADADNGKLQLIALTELLFVEICYSYRDLDLVPGYRLQISLK